MASNLSARARTLEGLIAALDEMSQRLKHLQPTMLGLMTSLCGRRRLGEPDIPAHCREGLMEGNSFSQSWRDAVMLFKSEIGGEVAEILISLGNVLGSTGLEEQLNAIACAADLLRARLELAREKSRKQGGLYRTMGVLAGSAVVILLI